MWLNVLIVVLSAAAMEAVAAFSHRYIMHGFGWRLHRSHHSPRTGWFELNDLYAVVFAGLAIVLIAVGTAGVWPLQWIGAGMTLYGVLYFLVHDGLVHQRWPFHWVPRKGYLKRLWLAHRFHHAVNGKEGCVSFGFLVVKSPESLQAQLRKRARPTKAAAAKAPSDAPKASPPAP
ncbi:sterol desaturase family protein [Atlantibacter hermannii]|uniref:sterol desaturase family protein n=1 Tax=Atlantibacter hermannii TaxID=565 RepID=UPI00289B296F|nr:sterol desaturase family protein [Atlantibacter hermannii]